MRFLVVVLLAAVPALAQERFYFSGDGTLRMGNAHFAETLDVRYRDASGRYDEAAMATIARFFRSAPMGAAGPCRCG